MARTLPSAVKQERNVEALDAKQSADATTAFKAVELTHQQNQDWEATRTAMLWVCPGFTRIMYTMCNPDGLGGVAYWTTDIPRAATDGVYLIFNPEWYFKLSLHERVFVLAHEILHMILNHINMGYRFSITKKVPYPSGKSLPYHAQLMNMAMDYVINAILVDSKVGTMPKEGLYDPTIGVAADSPIDVYRKLFDEAKKNGGGGGDGSRKGQKGFDDHLAPGKSKGKNAAEVAAKRDEGEWQAAVAAAQTVAKSQGKLPAALERLFSSLLKPNVDWRDALPAAVARSLGSDGYSWRRLDRRLILQDIAAPGRSKYNSDAIAIAVDTSGSIGQREIDVFFAEMRGILEDCRPRTVYVMWCDARVHKVDEIEDSSEIDTLKPRGGGGTDFRPVFDWLRDSGIVPDALVYFTDLMGTFPDKQPGYPVVWASTVKDGKYPWGSVVDVPIKD